MRPQFLQRAWAETTSDEQVETFRLDLPGVPSRRWSPKSTGYEENLYALTLPLVACMEQQAVENHVLRHIDTRAAALHLSDVGVDCSDWVRFLMSLRLRQPDIIQQLRTEVPEHLVDNQKIGLKIARMKCWLYPFATAKHDLLLADHPCIFTVGIDNPDLIIAPPIGPRKAFMAAGSERLANILRQQRPKHLLTC